VTWLATWTENIQGQIKYVMLNPASRLKGEKDWQKYEKARKLHTIIDRVRENYTNDWKSKEMKIRQRAVAIYFIGKLHILLSFFIKHNCIALRLVQPRNIYFLF